MAIQSPLLTAREAMTYLRKSRPWITRHADELGCVRDGGRLYFFQRDLDAYLARCYVRPRAELVPHERRRPVRLVTGAGTNPVTGLPWGALG